MIRSDFNKKTYVSPVAEIVRLDSEELIMSSIQGVGQYQPGHGLGNEAKSLGNFFDDTTWDDEVEGSQIKEMDYEFEFEL